MYFSRRNPSPYVELHLVKADSEDLYYKFNFLIRYPNIIFYSVFYSVSFDGFSKCRFKDGVEIDYVRAEDTKLARVQWHHNREGETHYIVGE